MARRQRSFGARRWRGRMCPEAGDSGFEPVAPKPGLRAYLTEGESGCMFPVRLNKIIGSFDGHPVWLWEWLGGPDRGKVQHGYGRGFWKKERRG